MASKDFDKETRERVAHETFAITKAELLDFMMERDCGRPCESCGHEEWTIPEENGAPSIICMDLVRKPGHTNWFFWMACNSCGNTRMHSSGHVWSYLKGKGKADE